MEEYVNEIKYSDYENKAGSQAAGMDGADKSTTGKRNDGTVVV